MLLQVSPSVRRHPWYTCLEFRSFPAWPETLAPSLPFTLPSSTPRAFRTPDRGPLPRRPHREPLGPHAPRRAPSPPPPPAQTPSGCPAPARAARPAAPGPHVRADPARAASADPARPRESGPGSEGGAEEPAGLQREAAKRRGRGRGRPGLRGGVWRRGRGAPGSDRGGRGSRGRPRSPGERAGRRRAASPSVTAPMACAAAAAARAEAAAAAAEVKFPQCSRVNSHGGGGGGARGRPLRRLSRRGTRAARTPRGRPRPARAGARPGGRRRPRGSPGPRPPGPRPEAAPRPPEPPGELARAPPAGRGVAGRQGEGRRPRAPVVLSRRPLRLRVGSGPPGWGGRRAGTAPGRARGRGTRSAARGTPRRQRPRAPGGRERPRVPGPAVPVPAAASFPPWAQGDRETWRPPGGVGGAMESDVPAALTGDGGAFLPFSL